MNPVTIAVLATPLPFTPRAFRRFPISPATGREADDSIPRLDNYAGLPRKKVPFVDVRDQPIEVGFPGMNAIEAVRGRQIVEISLANTIRNPNLIPEQSASAKIYTKGLKKESPETLCF